ncbi:MAG: radical SAM protein [Clostridia bacterium]|nr:radical SAM protein [Clostridia bacterium]
MYNEYRSCRLCPRDCGIDRTKFPGRCGETHEIRAARAALHFWEEPPISMQSGSGAVFFSGCSLRCVYCQNREISRGHSGKIISADRLCEIFFELAGKGAENINLVTAAHFLPQVAEAVGKAKKQGFTLPFVYNSSGYEKTESLRRLDGLIDIYLPDFKYYGSEAAAEYSSAPDYPQAAKEAIAEMFRQRGPARFSDSGKMLSGMIVRHLVLPGETAGAKRILRYLYRTYGDAVFVSIMRQYTPLFSDLPKALTRRVTDAEYDSVVSYAQSLGIRNAFLQSGESAKESFIPAFDNEGI